MTAGPEQLSFETALPADREELEGGGESVPAAVATPAELPQGPFPPTAEQRAAIEARDRDVFLEAGAGTGKTRVLVDRYCDAVDLDEIEPERILAFTFTEKAAAEMRRRARVELMRRARTVIEPERRARLTRAARAGEGAPITTIHGFCRRLLAAHPALAGLDPRFRVLDADEAGRLAALAFERALELLAGRDEAVARVAAGYRHKLGGLIRAAHADLRNHGARRPELPALQISAFEGAGDEPPSQEEIELADSSYGALRRLLKEFAGAYETVKAERSGVDFDDLQLIALELLEGNPGVAAAYRDRYAHLLVDEFQDTSPLQVGIVRALAGGETRLFTVGDEFQSIYAFRGADLASFRAERRRIREADPAAVLPLSGSFRSSPEVVAAVNAVGRCLLGDFRELQVGRAPEEEPAGPSGPKVELLLTERAGWKDEGMPELATAATETEPNRIAEARNLARRLRELADGGVAPGSMVLLLRAFTHVDAYAEALELAGLDPYVVGGRGYWSAQQVEDALRLLACVANPLDDEALLGALASPACGAGADCLWLLRRAAGRKRHLWPAVEAHLLGLREPPGSEVDAAEREEWQRSAEWAGRIEDADRERVEGFARRLLELREEAPLLPLDALVESALERFDYDLAALALPGGKRRAANLLKLVRVAGEYESHEGRDLRGFLAYASERAARSDREAEATIAAEDHDGITVMTVHAAKGLEFDCVAVADLGRAMRLGGAPPDLRLAFGERGDEAEERHSSDAGENGPHVGLRLARAGAPALTLEGYRDLNDDAAQADSQESARLAYVAVSRARERLLLSGLYDQRDVEGDVETPAASHSVLARVLPAFGVDEGEKQTVWLPPAKPRADLGVELGSEPVPVDVTLNRASAEAVDALRFDLREEELPEEPGAGGRPPMLALSERGGSAARGLSYAALADYQRCGYRFLTERVLGLAFGDPATGPQEPGEAGEDEPFTTDSDEEPIDPGFEEGSDPGRAAVVAIRRSRLGFGRAVHELLERSARQGWRRPAAAQVVAALAAEQGDERAAQRAGELLDGWLRSPLLAELREAGAEFRPEVPFRVELGRETVLRGTIDLLALLPDRPPLVIDYKTDARAAGPGGELPDSYLIQRDLYAHAVAAATGAESVSSAYVFLTDPSNPVRTELDRGMISAGRERIEALIERIRERRFDVTETPHAGLCHDCPARPRLCPHPPERTLARTPAP